MNRSDKREQKLTLNRLIIKGATHLNEGSNRQYVTQGTIELQQHNLLKLLQNYS